MIPETFTRNTEPALATYDAVDIAAGLGYQTFYLFTLKNDTTTEYALSNIQCFSNSGTLGNGTFNFDTTAFNLPRILKGDVYADVAGGSGAGNFQVSGSVILNRGGTLTTLGSFTTENFVATTQTQKTCKMAVAQTEIKRGDIIRLAMTSNSANNNFNTDPTGAYSIAQTTKLRLPFKIDL